MPKTYGGIAKQRRERAGKEGKGQQRRIVFSAPFFRCGDCNSDGQGGREGLWIQGRGAVEKGYGGLTSPGQEGGSTSLVLEGRGEKEARQEPPTSHYGP